MRQNRLIRQLLNVEPVRSLPYANRCSLTCTIVPSELWGQAALGDGDGDGGRCSTVASVASGLETTVHGAPAPEPPPAPKAAGSPPRPPPATRRGPLTTSGSCHSSCPVRFRRSSDAEKHPRRGPAADSGQAILGRRPAIARTPPARPGQH